MRLRFRRPSVVKFLVLALFYGDHPELALRCGQTLRALWNTGRVDLRLGLNEVSPRSREVLDALLPGVDRIEADPQIYKFPMMRRLLQTYAGDATHLMWFDDDSCLQPGIDARAWLDAVGSRAAACTGSLGATFQTRTWPKMVEWIHAQDWSTGRAVPERLDFTVGGWMVVPLALLRRLDWPREGLRHNGGDIELGAVLHQQGLAPEMFRMGLAINADAALVNEKAARRGFSEEWLS